MAEVSVVLTSAHVANSRTERSAIIAEREALDARLALVERKIAAAELLLPELARVPESALDVLDEGEPSDSANMTQAIARFLEQAPKGATYKAIFAHLQQIEAFADRLSKNSQYPYTAVGRMMKRQSVVKAHDRFFTPSNYLAFTASDDAQKWRSLGDFDVDDILAEGAKDNAPEAVSASGAVGGADAGVGAPASALGFSN
jgi:hypothetical protein